MIPEIIEKPPSNVAEYVGAKPNDIREKFVKDLADLLKQDTFNIRTEPILIAWATEAIDKAKPKNYRIMMQRAPVNFGEPGDAFGIFFFERKAPSGAQVRNG